MALTEKLTSIADAIRAQSGKADKLTLAQMPNEIAGLQGLNFTVVGGAAAPASPAENTIWVNTTAAITSWIFSASQPESPTTGMVWFSVGTASPAEFNALKKNSIHVYPLSAQQYIGGSWEDKTAKSYLGGAWTGWSLVLVPNAKTAWEVSSSSVTVNQQTGETTFDTSVHENQTKYAYCTVDLTTYSQLKLTGHAATTSSGGGAIEYKVGIFDTSGTFVTGWTGSLSNAQSADFDKLYDISALTGTYQLRVSFYAVSSSETYYYGTVNGYSFELM